MDREKVIKTLEYCVLSDDCRPCEYFMEFDDTGCQIMKDALALLKEQEPVEVIHHEAPYGYPYNTGKCPVCFQQLDEGDKFCRECGPAVKWE